MQAHTTVTHPTIMVVDDDPYVCDMLEEFLDDVGLETISAPNGRAALSLLQHQRPVAIILDLMMPVMDGWAFLNKLEEEQLDKIPVIMFSANMHVQDHPSASKVYGFLSKPFDLEELYCLLQPFVKISIHA